MKNMNFSRTWFLFIMSFLMILFSAQSSELIYAADTPSREQVYRNTPAGLDITDYMSYTEKYDTGTNNVVEIISKGSADYGNPVDIIQMMDEKGSSTQLSSIWGRRVNDKDSTDENVDNYFDLGSKQKISLWLYFGDVDPYADLDANDFGTIKLGLPDGLALVLQDDARGNGAIALSNSNLARSPGGETLGVWGSADPNFSIFETSNLIGSSAIKNSLAVEFDTFQNEDEAKRGDLIDNFFDGMKEGTSKIAKGQHIAWEYPGGDTVDIGPDIGGITSKPDVSPNTYYANSYQTGSHWSPTDHYFYGMNHRGIIQNQYLSGYEGANDKPWRHFTLSYVPPEAGSTKAHISYAYNDKDYNGLLKPVNQRDAVRNQEVDLSKVMKNNNRYVRWGFTAATGSRNSKQSTFAIIMQEMPNVANIDTPTKLFDLSQYDDEGKFGREITDLGTKTTNEFTDNTYKNKKYNVANGDSLRFDYNLNYSSGFAGTGDQIVTNVKLPRFIDFTPDVTTELGSVGYFGQVVYSGFENSSDNKIIPLAPSDIITDESGNMSIKMNLNKMSNKGESIKIELFGKAVGTTIPQKVPNAHTSYNSMHFIDDVLSPAFVISDSLNLTTNDNLDLGVINATGPKDTVNLNLTTKYTKDTSVFDGTEVKLYTQIDNNKATAQTLSISKGTATYDIANNLVGATQFDASTLGVGDHLITVYVVDNLNRTTDAITYRVTVEGKQLDLLLNDEVYKFKDVNYLPDDGYIHRQGDWKVSVISADTQWTLTATGADLALDDHPEQTIGPMVYHDKNNKDSPLDTGTPIIAYDDEADPETTTTNVSGKWSENDGILLRDTAVRPAGHYTGRITWNLTDSVQ